MPNHVVNILTISGDADLVAKIKSEISSVDEEGNTRHIDFHMVAPLPEDLKGTTSPTRIIPQKDYDKQEARIAAGDLEEHEERFGVSRGITREMSEAFKKKYGHDNWYDWQREAWGTKWNAYEQDLRDNGDIKFETAWSTPFNLILRLSAKYPEAEFKVRFADEDFGHNVGEYIVKAGEEIDEDLPKGGSHEAYMMAAEIRDEWDYLVQSVEGLEEEEMNEAWAKAMIQAVYEKQLFSDYTEYVWKAIQDKCVMDENYEFAQKIKEHLERSSV